MTTNTFHISGTHCPACKKLTEKRILGVNGVKEVDVNYETGEAKIVADQAITKEEINKALASTPYKIL